jgi:hypothetical protein
MSELSEHQAVAALVGDLHWQIDQMPVRGIKNEAGHVYIPHYYKRSLDSAIERGDQAVVEYVRAYLYKSPSDGYKKLEDANSLDLACEALVADQAKPYAPLFSAEDRVAANERLAPHLRAIEERNAEERARIDAARAELKRTGMRRTELDASLRTRRDLG